MLKAKSKYAIIALIEMYRSDKVISSYTISQKYNIPSKFLEQILNDLKNYNIIQSTRGAFGGYQLVNKNILLKDILDALHETISVTACNDQRNCANGEKCASHDLWSLLEAKLTQPVYSISLAEMAENQQQSIYADYQATTPVAQSVLKSMIPFFIHDFGNPHSRTHSYGWNAKKAVDNARKSIAKVINANDTDIIFTSGATEANNLAILGLAKFYTDKKQIIIIKTEHKCVINTCLSLENHEVLYADIDQDGIVNLDSLRSLINENTLLVSISGVNSEIGVIQPLEEIGKICAEKKVFFHSDIAQAYGKIDIDVQKMNIHLASISCHKIYGPKGIGALYINRNKTNNRKRPKIVPLLFGGGQEFGLRSGTVPTPLVVGFGAAAELALANMYSDMLRLKHYFTIFTQHLESNLPKIKINGSRVSRYYGNVNVSFRGIEGESLILSLKNIAVSSGSACTSESLETSYVLKNIGLDDYMAHSSIRFSFGRYTTESEVMLIANKVVEAVRELRNNSPFWELEEKGQDLSSLVWTHCH